jgi:hypothetical protein
MSDILHSCFSLAGRMLLESKTLFESSELMSDPVIKQHKHASLAVAAAHKELGLSHEQTLNHHNIKNYKWSQLKDIAKDKGWRDERSNSFTWMIIFGQNGTTVVHIHEVKILTNPEFQSFRNEVVLDTVTVYTSNSAINTKSNRYMSGEKMMTDIKQLTGPLYKDILAGTDTKAATKLKTAREKSKSSTISYANNYNLLLDKLKPLLLRILKQSAASIRGHLMDMTKTDAISTEEFQSLRTQLSELNDLIDVFEHKLEDDPLRFNKSKWNLALLSALAMTASHFYPEQTGSITAIGPERIEGVKKILADLDNKNNKVLSTLIYYFKRAMLLKGGGLYRI